MGSQATSQMNQTNENQLLFIGDGLIATPYSLIFNTQLSALDVRLWLAIRVLSEHQQTVSHNDLCEYLNESNDAVIESLSMLDIVGWLVIKYVDGVATQPMIATTQLTSAQILQYNPHFEDNLHRYIETGSRLKEAAKKVIDSLQYVSE